MITLTMAPKLLAELEVGEGIVNPVGSSSSSSNAARAANPSATIQIGICICCFYFII